MDRFFQTQQTIHASPQKIWAILTDAARLTQGFGIIRIDGIIAAGARIKLWSEVDPSRAFPLRVVEFTPYQRMIWQGGMPFGLFVGRRSYSLDALKPDQTRFVMREDYTGLMAGMIFPKLPDMNPSFEKFGLALKREAEK